MKIEEIKSVLPRREKVSSYWERDLRDESFDMSHDGFCYRIRELKEFVLQGYFRQVELFSDTTVMSLSNK